MPGTQHRLTDINRLTGRIGELLLLIPLILVSINNNRAAGLSCLSCDDISRPDMCNTTIECRDGEDCKGSQDVAFVGRRKRVIGLPTYCGRCCDDSGGCNGKLCGLADRNDRTNLDLVQPPLRTDPCTDLTPVSCSLLVIEEPSICDSSGIKHYACRRSCGTCNKHTQHLSDCFYQSQKYEGMYTTTRTGKPCVPWAKFVSNATSLLSKLPDKSLTSAANKCRDPDARPPDSNHSTEDDITLNITKEMAIHHRILSFQNRDEENKGHPWCYIDPDMDWEYCAVPFCQECYFPNDTTQYRGYVSATSDGVKCEPWTANPGIPFSQTAFPDGSEAAAENYCRDPFKFEGKLLCYTKAGYRVCSVPKCPYECQDNPSTDCALISKYLCASEYTSITLCPKTCGKCYFGLLPPRIISPPTGVCEDKPDANCFVLSNFICSDPKGSRELCPKTCKICCFVTYFNIMQRGECACTGINEPDTERSPTQASFNTGDTVTYACVTGYTLTSGSITRTCQSNTTWTGSPPVCTIVSCASPPVVANSSSSPSQASYNYTSSITYTCEAGFTHTSGNLTRSCQEDTTWSGTEPVCSIVSCSSPPAVANASISPSQASYNYTSSITYICEVGFTHTSGNLTRICQDDTSWSGTEPVCTVVSCASPLAVANASSSPSQSSYNYTSSITYTCEVGFTHTSGNLTRICQEDSTWSGSEPECTIVSCASPPPVANSSFSPSQASYNYTSSIIYTCEVGFTHTNGNLTRTCQEDTTWSGTEPECTIVSCASPPAVSNSSISPSQTSYNYSESIAYTCEVGFTHTSGNLTRICQADTTWSGTEPLCSIVSCASPPTIANSSSSPSQASYNYTSSITYTCEVGFTHTSGNLTRTCQQDTTWSGTEPVCSIVSCASPPAVANSSSSPSQASFNYSSSITYTCEVGFMHTSGNLTRICQEDTLWSGTEPICSIKTCTDPPAVPFSTHSPNQTVYNYSSTITYVCDTGYSRTSDDLIRICQDDSTWSGNEPTCTIVSCASPPAVANSLSSPSQASYNYSSSITYTCDVGFTHTNGNLTRICQEDTTWSGDEPTCTIVVNTCVSPSAVINATRSPDLPSYNYNTTIMYSCDTGFSHTSGDLTRLCQADTSWSGIEPVCTINVCASPPAIPNSSRSPDQASYNYSTTIVYACDTGYSHTSGDLTRICEADTTWSGSPPVCSINTCASPAVSNSSVTPDQTIYNYTTSVTITCDTGFTHTSGDNARTCQANSTWSGTDTVCTINTCASPPAVANSSRLPDQAIYNYSTSITYSCDAGFEHSSGDLVRTCKADTTWSGVEPVCTIKTCASPAAVLNSVISPDQAVYNYTDVITYACNTGYTHTSGDLSRTCSADTTWSGSPPVCTINTCVPDSVANSTLYPDQSVFNYTTSVTYTCDQTFNHTAGDLTRHCQADSTWNGTTPVCTVAACLPHPPVSLGTVSPTKTQYDFGEAVTMTCNTGYYVSSGSGTRTCQTSGAWDGSHPVCSIVICADPSPVSDSTLTPVGPYQYNTSITYACNLAYIHTTGNLTRTCQDDFSWSGTAPVCTIDSCIKENSTYMTVTPTSLLHNFGDVVTYTCITGYNYSTGDESRTCLNDGSWTGTLPECVIVTCSLPIALDHSSISPNQALIEYNNIITYNCDTGYNRTDGDETRTCLETGLWSGIEANCTLVTCSPPDDITYSSYSPVQAIYNYSTVVTYTCDYGYYVSSGTLTTSCDENGAWTGPAPVCSIVQCNVISEDHSSYSPVQTQFDFNTTVTYTCDTGHNRTSGNDVRTCQNDTSWDGIAPVCDPVVCSFPETVDYSTSVPSQVTYVYQDWINYTCILGYNMTRGDCCRQCDQNAEWTGTLPNCTLVTCEPPVDVTYASYQPIQAYYNYSTVVTYACDYGYELSAGVLVTTCDENAQWTGTTPTCSIVQCTVISEDHSSYSPVQTVFDFNKTVTYTCDTGHNRTSGNDIRTCQNDTSWNGVAPVCDPVVCSFPETVDYSTSVPSQVTYVYQDWINYTCILGYNMTSGDCCRQCDQNAEWTGTLPNCTLITCSPPPNITSSTYQPIQSIYNYSTIVTYKCDNGFYLDSGSLTTQCDETAAWTGTSPVCLIVECVVIPEPNSTFSPNQTIFDFNTNVTYTCNIGHNVTSGNDVRTCQNDTSWSGDPPTCDPVVCSFPKVVDFSTSVPSLVTYVYLDWIYYTCNFGYEMTSGNSSRQCDEHAEWTGVLPNCTIKKCVPPPVSQNSSYVPLLLEHNWNTSVTFSCDTGYEYDTGDTIRTCLDNKTWSGQQLTCKIKKCPRIDVNYATLTPADTGGEYDYLTEITYECVLGYNHTYGDLQRTCLDTKDWSGSLPNCSIVTCDPPTNIPHTSYLPVQPEYIWQTEIYYTCDSLYHFVTGTNFTACNESGLFPDIDFNCSVKHTLVKNSAEPAYAWINETVTSVDIVFDFDGMCDVMLYSTPTSINMSRVISGTTLTVTVSENNLTEYGTYVVRLSPFRLGRNFNDVSTNVYYGREITGLQGWVNNPITTLMVDGEYNFEINVTDGTTVQLDWDFEGSGIVTQNVPGLLSSANQSHIFNSPGWYNVTVTASNAISSQTVIIPVRVVYGVNNIVFIATTNTPNTTQTIDIQLKVKSSAFLPMYEVNITVYFGDDTANISDSDYIDTNLSLPHFYSYSHLYPVQGDYYARAMVSNSIDTDEYTQTIRVWDQLDNLNLVFKGGNGIYVTNATAEFEFVLPPESGFLYTIDYGDGSALDSFSDTEIYKHPYNFTSFSHAYSNPGVYHLRWTAANGLYSRDETKVIIVQNPLPTHSYALEPIGKKYPWSVLQVIDVSLNITLNNTVALPTNATCDFDAKDGSSVVSALDFNGAFFQHLHRFLIEGSFQPVFNCSNLVSSYDYVFNLTVMKYIAQFTSLVFVPDVPLNISDSVTVYFHIDNNGFALLPFFVTLTFDFGNGIMSYSYDRQTYSRTYTARGNYNVSIMVESSVTSTSDTQVYPLRLGLMYFDYNSSVQFINDTLVTYSMHGVLGTTTYTVDYTDGSGQKSCMSTDKTGCDIHHLCPKYSNNTNIVTANNGTFVEIDEAYVVCDNPIAVTIDHPEFKAIPDGIVDLKLRITENDLYIPHLFCDFTFGDPIKKETYLSNQTVTFDDPFNYTFQYIALGRHIIDMVCWNMINQTTISSMITLTNKDFLFFGSFDRQYSQRATPVPLSPMREAELFSRLVILANSSEKNAGNDWLIDPTVSLGAGTNRYSLLFPIGQVREGVHKITLRTYFIEEPDNVIFEPTFVNFVIPPPQVHIIGGRVRRMPRSLVILDVKTLSFDPVNTSATLDFGTWRCFSYDATSFIDAENKFMSNNLATVCSSTPSSDNTNLSLDMTALPHKEYYVVEATGENAEGVQATSTQIIQIVDNSIPLAIRCLINCLSKVAVTSYLVLSVDVDHNCPATFTWTLQVKGGPTVSLSGVTETGTNKPSLSLKPNTLSPGTWYIVSVVMTYEGEFYGPAYHEFLTNRPPQNGTCDVYQFNSGSLNYASILSTSVPYETRIREDEFNISCSNWLDEGFTENTLMEDQPLFYQFYFKYGQNTADRQILYFDPGKTSNLVTLRIGNPATDYSGTLVLRIADVIGDYTEISYNLVVRPPVDITTEMFTPLDDSAQLAKLQQFTDYYEEEIIKANRTWDYRSLSRKIQDVTSVYNQLELNSTVTIVLTPEDLLTLGNQRNEKGEVLSWNEYWNLIVDVQESQATNHLVEFGERLTASLHYTVNTWPENKRMPLISIETISKGLSATLERTEYANITAAIHASYSSETLAENLVSHTLDRVYPPTEQLMSAMTELFDLNMNILELLQTVLTPNLPEDPTVDEMRSYLEYIKTFEGTGNTRNQSQLSLQEQTFLAQKQLQKYYLQKYIKSEASKTCLPMISNTYDRIAGVLKSMSTLGRQEFILENDFTYLSVEKERYYQLRNSEISRPKMVMQVGSLVEDTPAQCNASEIAVMTKIFKNNPYFWGDFADRITSYVSEFKLDGATQTDTTITYRIQNQNTPSCTDVTPNYDENDENKMIYILLNRRYQDDDLLIFVRPEATALTYDVFFNEGEKPDLAEEKFIYQTKIHTNMWTAQDGYKLLVTSQEFSATGQIWIALRPILDSSQDESALKSKFCARVTSVNCVVWRLGINGEYSWDRFMCGVSELSSRSETVCVCQNRAESSPITIGTTFYVPESKVDFKDIDDSTIVYSHQPVYYLIYATFGLYFLLVIWMWREDLKDPYKWSYSLMIDNDIADQHFYIIRVYTGMRSGAGTRSKIAFILAGENTDTGIRILDDHSHIGFDRGSVRTFVMGTRRNLGQLMSIRIWHDDTGVSEAAWYLNQITVTDLDTFQMFGFYCDNWLDYDRGDQRVDRVLGATPIEVTWTFQEMASYIMAEHHLWISVFLRPFRSSFTRVQRLSCLLAMFYLNMFLTTLFLKTKTEEDQITTELNIGPFRFSAENFEVALKAVCISTFILTIVSFLFRFSRNRNSLKYKDSFLIRQYKRLNNWLIFDKTVYTLRFPPAENSIVYDYNFLPHFVMYVAWALLGLFVGLCAYFMMTTSKSWPEVKSEEWMTTVIVSILVSILIIDIIKVGLIILPYLLLCKRAYEPPRPYIDVETLKEITKYNSASLTVSPGELESAVSPDEDTLIEHKKERMKNHQLLKMFTQLALYSGVLFIVYTISYAKRDTMSYNLKRNVEESFKFNDVTDIESFVNWLNGRFADQYFSHSFFGQTYTETDIKPFAEDLVNYRVGPARLRQLRIKPEPCLGPLGEGEICYSKYKENNIEEVDYCLGWKYPPCDVTEKSDYFTSPAWEYKSAAEVWGFFTMATYATYGGGGYFMKLDVNRDVCLRIFDELVKFGWFDRRTRVAILEFTLYNANKNLFVYSKFVGEFPEVGGVLTYTDIQVFRLYLNTGENGDMILLLEFLFAILVIGATIKMIAEIATDGFKFFKSAWNLLDISALCMSYTTIIVYIYKLSILDRTISTFHADKNAYVGFENLAFYDYFVNTTLGLTVFLLSVRVSKILGYSSKINEMAEVLSSSASDLGGFFLIFAIAYFAYVILGTELFRNDTEKYKDMFQTYGTLTEAIVGKNRLANILTSKPGYAEFYYFTFVLFVLLTLATLAAAILNFSISHVKEEQKKMAPTNIVEILVDRITWLFRKISGMFKRNSHVKLEEEDDSDEEANAKVILEDIGLFIKQQLQINKGNRADAYRVSSPDSEFSGRSSKNSYNYPQFDDKWRRQSSYNYIQIDI